MVIAHLNRKASPLFLLLFLAFVSCVGKRTEGIAAFKNVEYFSEFPINSVLKEGELFDVDVMGINDIDVESGFLLVSTMGSDKQIIVFDENTKEKKGDFYRAGNGPGEVPFTIFFNNFVITRSNSGPMGYLYDATGKLSVVDILQSAETGFPEILSHYTMERGLRSCFPISEGCYLCHKWNHTESGLSRFIVDHNQKKYLPVLGQLDSARITVPSEGFKFNILGTSVSVNQDAGMAAECSLRLNTIHVYSLTGDKSKTLCYGDKIDDFTRLETLDISLYPKTFSLMQSYLFGFSCLYSSSELMLFNWDGDPLAKISL